MKVVRSKVIGYCFGVANTIEKAEQCIAQAQKEGVPCYSIGAIIHNKDVVSRFSELGMVTTKDPQGLEPGLALIRAHGIADSVRRSYLKAGFTLVDSTCPIVAKGAVALRKAASKGIRTIILGVRGHAETVGLQGVETEDGKRIDSILICNLPEAIELVSSGTLDEESEIVAVVQTTFPEYEYSAITAFLREHYPKIRFSTSPCGATSARQKAAVELAKSCDAIVVIGGRNSENTKALARAVKDACPLPVYCIENCNDLEGDLLRELSGFSTVGLCSGSSTPTSVIREVEEKLERL